jgi:hypothetical protein
MSAIPRTSGSPPVCRATTIAIACERLEGEAAAGNEINLEVYGTLTDRLGRHATVVEPADHPDKQRHRCCHAHAAEHPHADNVDKPAPDGLAPPDSRTAPEPGDQPDDERIGKPGRRQPVDARPIER